MNRVLVALAVLCASCTSLQPLTRPAKLSHPWPCSLTPINVWYARGVSAGWVKAYEWARRKYTSIGGRALGRARRFPYRAGYAHGSVLIATGKIPKGQLAYTKRWHNSKGALSAVVVLPRHTPLSPLRRLITLHELGHVLGLDHSKNRKSVMYENLHSFSQKLLPAEISAIRRYRCQ